MMFTTPKLIVTNLGYSFPFINMSSFSVSFFLFRNGHLDIVQYLVDGGHCQPNSRDKYGYTALYDAAE